LRTLALPDAVEHWSLTTPREKLVKIGAKVVRQGRYVMFQLAEVAIPRRLFAAIPRLIDDHDRGLCRYDAPCHRCKRVEPAGAGLSALGPAVAFSHPMGLWQGLGRADWLSGQRHAVTLSFQAGFCYHF